MTTNNYGIQNTGPGILRVVESAVGQSAVIHNYRPFAESATDLSRSGDGSIGILTILSEEMRAVLSVLRTGSGYRQQSNADGTVFHEAWLGSVRLVATQTLDRGQRSATLACQRLLDHCSPRLLVMVGIAGGIHDDVALGDVVVAEQLIYYDARKERSDGTRRRGQAHPISDRTARALNRFFTAAGEPARLPTADGGTFAVMRGPVGSGEAVVADHAHEIRSFLSAFNDKTLAVETEGGGLAQAFHEVASSRPELAGWLSVRGISDHADKAKDDSAHHLAAQHAAETLLMMVPYLVEIEEAA
ncbi:5'-methylthioadenosine/S-adenosylhomocysteine nucleosidase [Longispora sp. NPDC051575]|uniref:5'-methylthioadenosine/S-adenosylhomocysteine nucleosidase n=1 Tax=Longispora sp. NPDC051575 TaxID=3154943 RepID=UPI0034320DA6